MNTPNRPRWSIVLVVALLAGPASLAPREASACGGYGDFAAQHPNHADLAAARLAAQRYAAALVTRDRAAARRAFTADAVATVEYHGCCGRPPQWTAEQWIERSFQESMALVGVGDVTRHANGEYAVQLVVRRGNAVMHETVTLRQTPAGFRVARVYLERAPRVEA